MSSIGKLILSNESGFDIAKIKADFEPFKEVAQEPNHITTHCYSAFSNCNIHRKAKAWAEMVVFCAMRLRANSITILTPKTEFGASLLDIADYFRDGKEVTDEMYNVALSELWFEGIRTRIKVDEVLYYHLRDIIHNCNNLDFLLNEEDLYYKHIPSCDTDAFSAKKGDPENMKMWKDKAGNEYYYNMANEDDNQKLFRLKNSTSEVFKNDTVRQRAIEAHKAITGASEDKLQTNEIGIGKYSYGTKYKF